MLCPLPVRQDRLEHIAAQRGSEPLVSVSLPAEPAPAISDLGPLALGIGGDRGFETGEGEAGDAITASALYPALASVALVQ